MKWQSITLPASARHTLLTPQQMAAVDARAEALGVPLSRLMDAAGYEVANLVSAHHAHGVAIVVLAGPGNNGGDAFVAAEVLRARGYKVAVGDLGGEGGRTGIAADAAAGYRGEQLEGAAIFPALSRADVVVDGLFGGGLSRDIAGELALLVEAVNGSRATVWAIDMPSGIDGASGTVRGAAIRAHRTVTFETLKPGHVLVPGRDHVGRVHVADIGMPRAAFGALAGALPTLNAPPAWGRGPFPSLAAARHKYDRGHCVVVSGPMTATGAARLSAISALRAGAGLVTVASPPDALLVNAAHLTTVMVRKVAGPEDLAALLADTRHNAVVLGMGMPVDETTAAMARAALASPAHVVLDAGALRALFASGPSAPFAERPADRPPVLTPHAGEMTALPAVAEDRADASKLDEAQRVAQTLGAILLHKGADTVVASAGAATVTANAPPWLATAGTGDVLAGIIGALLAQGFEPYDAARISAWLHADAAERAGPAMIADDLIAALREARAALETRLTEASDRST